MEPRADSHLAPGQLQPGPTCGSQLPIFITMWVILSY